MSLLDFSKGFIAVISSISGIVTIGQYFKIKPMTIIQAAKSQSGKIFIWSAIITVLLFVIPWNEIHFGKQDPIIKIVKVHDTTYKHDTVYIHDKAAKKTFQNKIDKVETLNQN